MFNNDEILVTLLAKNTNCSNLLESKQYLKTLYLQDHRPWVVAFSGGKDSTLVLQLVCEMLLELGDQANKHARLCRNRRRAICAFVAFSQSSKDNPRRLEFTP